MSNQIFSSNNVSSLILNDIILTGIGSKSSIVDTLGQRPGMTFASRNPKTAKNRNNFTNDILKIC